MTLKNIILVCENILKKEEEKKDGLMYTISHYPNTKNIKDIVFIGLVEVVYIRTGRHYKTIASIELNKKGDFSRVTIEGFENFQRVYSIIKSLNDALCEYVLKEGF